MNIWVLLELHLLLMKRGKLNKLLTGLKQKNTHHRFFYKTNESRKA